jgi:hypothetical protein
MIRKQIYGGVIFVPGSWLENKFTVVLYLYRAHD